MKRDNNLIINRTEVLFFFLLLPFFEPGCIGIFVDNDINTSFFSLIGKFFAIGRYAASLAGLLMFYRHFISRRKKPSELFSLFILIYCLSIISNVINGASLSSILSGIYEIGFICICELLIKKGNRRFLNVLIALFGILCTCGVISILLYPNGFNDAPKTDFAIYFLGSKNAAINIYILFFLAFLSGEYNKKMVIPIKAILFLSVFMITGFIMRSGSTIICLAILIGYCLIRIVTLNKFVIRPWIPFAIVVFGVLVVYIGINYDLFNRIVSLVGRDLSFHGRRALWSHAIKHFNSSPILGVGVEATFLNYGGTVQTSAHSQYLDRLAKYGLISFVVFIYLLIKTETDLLKSKDKNAASVFGLVFSIYMLKMGFDTYDFKLLVIIIYLLKVSLENININWMRDKKLLQHIKR